MTINRIDLGEEKYLLKLFHVLRSLFRFLKHHLNTIFRQGPTSANELHAERIFHPSPRPLTPLPVRFWYHKILLSPNNSTELRGQGREGRRCHKIKKPSPLWSDLLAKQTGSLALPFPKIIPGWWSFVVQMKIIYHSPSTGLVIEKTI